MQSTLFNYAYVTLIMHTLHAAAANIKTGASAASALGQSSATTLPAPPPSHQTSPNPAINHSSTLLADPINSSMVNKQPIVFGIGCAPRLNESLRSNESNSSSSSCLNLDLVEECPCFRCEIGGDTFRGLGLVHDVSQRRMMKLSSVCVLEKCSAHYRKELCDSMEANANEPFTVEYQDWGAYFYRFYFGGVQDHANYVGCDKCLGPVAISIRRDKLTVEPLARANSSTAMEGGKSGNTPISSSSSNAAYDYAYRFILRTCDVCIFVSELHIP